ncbi:hypothetical protein [Delftia acidovorans]|uniref:hypothetical protein n=2 Tax=Delftia acidovorans TaxID=80866 RepID=UPI0028B1779D|nr:hypothetical protein [Delftia acidovorans]
MTPRPPPSAEHFTQVVTEVDRLVQQGCAEISALSRMALLWLETPETSNRLDALASALRTIRNSADMLASETSGEVVAVGCSHHVKSSTPPEPGRAQQRPAPCPLPYVSACVGPPAGLQSCRRTGLLRQLTRRSCLNGARSAQ